MAGGVPKGEDEKLADRQELYQRGRGGSSCSGSHTYGARRNPWPPRRSLVSSPNGQKAPYPPRSNALPPNFLIVPAAAAGGHLIMGTQDLSGSRLSPPAAPPTHARTRRSDPSQDLVDIVVDRLRGLLRHGIRRHVAHNNLVAEDYAFQLSVSESSLHGG